MGPVLIRDCGSFPASLKDDPADRPKIMSPMSATPKSEKQVTVQDAKEHGLTEEEFLRIQEFLNGRLPTETELGMYSALWSEHCSYKNSILQLKTLPTESDRALTKAGEENAGALDIDDGLAVVFKIESHNHPTAIEPYQGAATGVGGIMRDIFTMGARPICSLNSLRFGPLDNARNRYLLSRAVKGIGDYGNSLGIAVSGGELFIDPTFSRNCLVNAMTVGVVEHDGMASALSDGVGNPVFIVGATTGRDGIHGASFASRDLSEESESKRSAVQVGDPFMEKLLLEATLELIASGAIVGIQDMGAAGLSCASSEMSAKGGKGMDIDLDKVPLRETGMNAYEIMLSESQERMLVTAHAGREAEVIRIFEKWNLQAVEIGTVTDDGMIKVRRNGELHADIPADSLVLGGGAPRYEREQKRPAYLDEAAARNFSDLTDAAADGNGAENTLLKLLASANICSRAPLTEQYDTEVGLVRVLGPGDDGGVARVPGTKKGIAVSTDCNSRYVYLDPRKGTAQSVFEAARNTAVTGARPLGITNCLNFGNPYIPENYYVFAECIAGMREACLKLKIPVTGGNVSFYNESEDGPVLPTPTIGMVSLLTDIEKVVRGRFRGAGDVILLVGDFRPGLGGTEYLWSIHNEKSGSIPELDGDAELRLIEFLVRGAERGLTRSAKDLSLGGLATALFRCARGDEQPLGFQLNKDIVERMRGETGRGDLLWFGETNGCAVVTVEASAVGTAGELARETGVKILELGKTADGDVLDYGSFTASYSKAKEAFEKGLADVF